MHTVIQQVKNSTLGAIEHLKQEYTLVQAGRASAALVENIMVESYGSMMPLKSVASINTPDASTISIQPWDKSMLSPIEKAIQVANLGLNPQSNSGGIIVPITKPTEEKRRELVKAVKQTSEEAKVQVRTLRHDALSKIKKEKEDGILPEDQFFQTEKELQKIVDDANKLIEELVSKKSAEIMTI